MPTEFMNVITTLRDAGIGIAALGILLYYMRSRGSADAKTSDQFKQVIVMLADSMKREDSETAKVMTPLVEIVRMAKISLDQNTAAFLRSDTHSAALLNTTKELTTLQAENNAQVAALGIAMSRIPDTINRVDINILSVVNGFGGLDENIRKILKAVESNPEDHRHVLEALASLAVAQTKIFTLIDSRLPASAKTITPPLSPHAPDTLGYDLLKEARRKIETGQMPKATPPDDPKDAA